MLQRLDNGLHFPGASFNTTRVRSKSLTAFTTALLLCSIAYAESSAPSRFIGAQNCSTSGCHGGAKRDEFIIWSKKDFHSRAFATLTTGRSQRIADTLNIADPTQSARCTACHAPMQSVLSARATEGVSCENCHCAAESWVRAHTRPDYTQADRVQAGMREVKSLYDRANACVACHQNVDADILGAGHPELIFELDGQAVSEPKHWREKGDWSGAQAWLVGQAVALREMSWQLSRKATPDEKLVARWNGLLWLLQASGELDAPTSRPADVQQRSDELARRAAVETWSETRTRALLTKLAGVSAAFEDATVSREVHARRAERLVLALDRLAVARQENKLDAEIGRLFRLTQSLPEFDPKEFGRALQSLRGAK
jgi:hypothetical protein